MAIPQGEEKRLDPISGYSVPPLDIWVQYNSELEFNEDSAHEMYWGTIMGARTTGLKTATEIIYNSQPMILKLDIMSTISSEQK